MLEEKRCNNGGTFAKEGGDSPLTATGSGCERSVDISQHLYGRLLQARTQNSHVDLPGK